MAGVWIGAVQRLVERLYQVETGCDVSDFLISDAATAEYLEGPGQRRGAQEKLLVHQDGDDLGVSLYLAQDVVDRLDRHNPLARLDAANLYECLLALAGVSHFVYLVWNARRERPVSLLELELQAEVDKYLLVQSLLLAQGGPWCKDRVHRGLFDLTFFDPQLEGAERQRYHDASRYAGRYCLSLQRRYPARAHAASMLGELRYFYRLSHTAKLNHIEHRH